jgi:uncharacterized membrane protein
MAPRRIALLYVVTSLAFFSIDLVWLGVVARDFYREQLGHLLADEVGWGAAIAFYLLYIGGILYFCVLPALREGSLGRAVRHGALFGLIAYSTYDLTNLATLRGFPPAVVAVDLAWGTLLTGATSAIGFLAARRLARK